MMENKAKRLLKRHLSRKPTISASNFRGSIWNMYPRPQSNTLNRLQNFIVVDHHNKNHDGKMRQTRY
jgi:hypothetical protein